VHKAHPQFYYSSNALASRRASVRFCALYMRSVHIERFYRVAGLRGPGKLQWKIALDRLRPWEEMRPP
jgi:hypothetical protein